MGMKLFRRRIIELGDDNVRFGRKLVDPHLCCYNSSYFMCKSNKNLKKDGTGNGTQGQLIRIKLKENSLSYQWEIWDNKKVSTVCASHVEYIEFKHHPKTHRIE